MDANINCAGTYEDFPVLNLFYGGLVRMKNVLSVLMQFLQWQH